MKMVLQLGVVGNSRTRVWLGYNRSFTNGKVRSSSDIYISSMKRRFKSTIENNPHSRTVEE